MYISLVVVALASGLGNSISSVSESFLPSASCDALLSLIKIIREIVDRVGSGRPRGRKSTALDPSVMASSRSSSQPTLSNWLAKWSVREWGGP